MSEELDEAPKPEKRKGRPPKQDAEATALIKALVTELRSSKVQTLDAETKANLDQEFKSQVEKYHAEPHYWVTFHYMGEEDKIDVVHIGAAGVNYDCIKEQRILLPRSALEALKGNVVVGLDYGHPIYKDGKKYLRRISRPLHSKTVEPGEVSPQEAAKWRAQIEKQQIDSQELVPAGAAYDGRELDLIEIG